MKTLHYLIIALTFAISATSCNYNTEKQQNTVVTIVEDMFFINGEPTYKGVFWNGNKIEGLLMNSRMVQGIFDDENPETIHLWKYPDTQEWSADRNTDEFIAAMPLWNEHGMLAYTLNLQGGSPTGYGNSGWINSAFDVEGNLKPTFAERLERILDKTDELGMVCILGVFYFGQDEFLKDEAAVVNAVDNTVAWINDKGYKNVIIEVANECNNKSYEHSIIGQDRIHELIIRIKEKAPELLVSTSFNGNVIPTDKVVEVSDYVLLHGNGVKDPKRITEMVEIVRELPSYRPMPIVFNEDDHYDFDKPSNNFVEAVKAYASWGYFDFRAKKGRRGAEFDEPFEEGFQSVPVDWGINSERKKEFFKKLKEITTGN